MSNEIKGVGNSYTAQFWEYDPRIGRRWNLDPVKKPWQSDYSAFSNSPIWKIDPNGDDDFFNSAGTYLGSTAKGNLVRVVNKNVTYVEATKNLSKTKLLTGFNYLPTNMANRSMLTQIVNHYAPKAGISESILVSDVDPKITSDAFAFWDSKAKTFNMAVNKETGAINRESDNYNNIIVSFVHEKVHKDDRRTAQPLYHVDAIIAEGNSSSFEGTTKGIKAGAGSYASQLLNEALSKGVPLSDVKAKMNDFNKSKLGNYSILTYDENQKKIESNTLLDEVIISAPARKKKN